MIIKIMAIMGVIYFFGYIIPSIMDRGARVMRELNK